MKDSYDKYNMCFMFRYFYTFLLSINVTILMKADIILFIYNFIRYVHIHFLSPQNLKAVDWKLATRRIIAWFKYKLSNSQASPKWELVTKVKSV